MNIDKLKNETVHTGLLEAMALLKQARSKINELQNDKEIKGYQSSVNKLADMSESVCTYEYEISEMIGSILFLRADEALGVK